MKQTIVKNILAGGLLVASMVLIGCSHENPLSKGNPELNAKALIHADKVAEQRLNLMNHYAIGHAYLGCMDKRQALSAKVCKQVFSIMLSTLHSRSRYKKLTLADLTSARMWQQMKPAYKRAAFDEIDYDD